MNQSMRDFAKQHQTALLVQAGVCVLFIFFVEWLQRQVLLLIGTDPLPHFGFRYWLSFALLGCALILFTRWRWLVLAIFSTLLFFIMAADQIYFTYFETMPTLRSHIPLAQALVVWESVLSLFQLRYLLPLVGLAGLWFYAVRALRFDLLKQRSTGVFILGKICGVVLLLVAGMIHMLATITPIHEETHHKNRPPMVLPQHHWGAQFSNLDYARIQGVIDYHLHDLKLAMKGKKDQIQLTEKEQKHFDEQLGSLRAQDGSGPLYGIAEGYNVIIIQLEALQYWVKDAVYEGTEVTPFLNKLYREQPHWDNIYDITFIGRTSDAEFALHTGMQPDMETASAFKYTNKDLFAFPRALGENGYATFSFHGFKKDFWNRTNTHPMFGIETMRFREDFPGKSKMGLGIPDKELYPEVAAHLSSVQQPFFAFVISLTNHHPFNQIPEESQGLFPQLSSVDGLDLYSGYLKLARYTDEAVAALVADLEQRGLLEKTLVVIYGDHDLGNLNVDDAQVYRTTASQISQLKAKLVDQLGIYPHGARHDRIPLTILFPDALSHAREQALTYAANSGTLCDVFPSIFHLLGKPVPKGVMGKHLFSEAQRVAMLPPFFDHVRKATYTRFYDRGNLYLLQGSKVRRFPGDGDPNITEPLFEPVPDALAREAFSTRTINNRLLRDDLQRSFRTPPGEAPTIEHN